MVGRFSEEKRYHWMLQDLFPKLMKDFSNIKLFIFSSIGTHVAREYYESLVKLALKNGLKVARNVNANADVHLVGNVSRSTINEVMDKAKVFLHATINEHLGIAVAEAMARGLPVVVHKFGGTWSDLAEEGKYGLGYGGAEEAFEVIPGLLTNQKVWKEFSIKSIEKARKLEMAQYIEKFGYLH